MVKRINGISRKRQILKTLKSKLKKKATGGARSRATRVLAQGVGAVTAAPLPKVQTSSASSAQLVRHGFNALSPVHLALPRPVGPYMVVRLTKLFTSSAKLIIFGTTAAGTASDTNEPCWSNCIAVEDVNPGLPINNPNNAHAIVMNTSNFTKSETWVPAAYTLQILNGESLQATTGIVCGGRVGTQLVLANAFRTWDQLADELVQFQKPRLMSAAKLSLRGVQCNAMPLDMSDLADFRPHQACFAGNFTWDGSDATSNSNLQFQGFQPIFVRNDKAPNLDLTFLVTVEYRLRFDPGNLACAGHSQHKPAPISIWEKAVNCASSMGHGMVDITEEVAEMGVAAGAARVAAAAVLA